MSELRSMRIIFKSGATVTVPIENFSVQLGPVTGDLRGFKWTYRDGSAPVTLDYIDPGSVAAIVGVPDSPADEEET